MKHSGVFKIHTLGFHQGEGKELHIAFCSNLVVQLADGTAAEIARILVLCIHILDLGIDPFEVTISDNRFPTQDELPLIRDAKRKIFEGFGVVGDRAYLMSKNLTQLGYDIASFYNISVEESMQKLKSGFAGELEPLALAA